MTLYSFVLLLEVMHVLTQVLLILGVCCDFTLCYDMRDVISVCVNGTLSDKPLFIDWGCTVDEYGYVFCTEPDTPRFTYCYV